MADERRPAGRIARDHERYGWTALFVSLGFGFTVEGLLGFKDVGYLLDPLRREFWQLAHFHGAALALVNLVYARSLLRAGGPPRAARGTRLASRALMTGSLLLPLGFFLGGLHHYEGDPGPGIFLVPPGALLVLGAVALEAVACWRGREPSGGA